MLQKFTLPWDTSSRWAAEAALTNAVTAAAMDLAASSICSSKFKARSASCNENRRSQTKYSNLTNKKNAFL